MFTKYFQPHGHSSPSSAHSHGASLQLQARPQPDLGVIAARRRQTPLAASTALASSFRLGTNLRGYSQLQGVEVQQGVAAARSDPLPLHTSVQQNLQTGYSLQQPLQARPHQSLLAQDLRFNSLQYQQPVQQAPTRAFIGMLQLDT